MVDIDISIPAGALTLRGSLALAGGSPAPAALLISGSGRLDRDSNSKRLSIDVMDQVAARLATDGVASLRYDKRGVGDSDGDFLSAGFHDNAPRLKIRDGDTYGIPYSALRPVGLDNLLVAGRSSGGPM